MTYFQRGLLAAILILVGLFFWPLLVLGAFIAWTVFGDIRDEPERKKRDAEMQARLNTPVPVEDLRWTCESPAEEAFFDAMVSAYSLKAGPGCITGSGLRLRTQVGLGQFHIGRSTAWHEFRADFLVDDKLVVEIDGAAWHGSPEAIAKDKARDEAIRKEGYTVLRIPAKVVLDTPKEAVKRVEQSRRRLAGTSAPTVTTPPASETAAAILSLVGSAAKTVGRAIEAAPAAIDKLDRYVVDAKERQRRQYAIDGDLFYVRLHFETALERATLRAKRERLANENPHFKAAYEEISETVAALKADRDQRSNSRPKPRRPAAADPVPDDPELERERLAAVAAETARLRVEHQVLLDADPLLAKHYKIAFEEARVTMESLKADRDRRNGAAT